MLFLLLLYHYNREILETTYDYGFYVRLRKDRFRSCESETKIKGGLKNIKVAGQENDVLVIPKVTK